MFFPSRTGTEKEENKKECPNERGDDSQRDLPGSQGACQIVTKKGKAFKYDAIECMMADIKERNEDEIGLFLMTDYSTPGMLVDATASHYLISENLPSPMGANLTGFKNLDSARLTKEERGGTLYNWDEY